MLEQLLCFVDIVPEMVGNESRRQKKTKISGHSGLELATRGLVGAFTHWAIGRSQNLAVYKRTVFSMRIGIFVW